MYDTITHLLSTHVFKLVKVDIESVPKIPG